jgi:transposase
MEETKRDGKMRTYVKWNDEDTELVLGLIKENKTNQEIAEIMNRSLSGIEAKVKRLKREHGLSVTNREFWSEDEINWAIQYYKQGQTLEAIAKKLNRPLHSVTGKVTNLINQGKLKKRETRPHPKGITERTRNTIIDLLKRGTLYSEIARKTNISVSSVKRYADKYNLNRSVSSNWKEHEIEKLLDLAGEYPFSLVAAQYNKWATNNGHQRRTHRAIRERIKKQKAAVRCIGSDEWLDAESVATIFNVHPATANTWFHTYKAELRPKEDGITTEKSIKRKLLVHRNKLAKWVDNHRFMLEKCNVDVMAIWSLARD